MDGVCVRQVPLNEGCPRCPVTSLDEYKTILNHEKEERRFRAALAALQGLAASNTYFKEAVPKLAVEMADALLKELERP